MFIKEFRIKNYIIHQDTSIKLLPLTVFVGPNGGGKSAFFDALLNFSMLSRGSIRQAFGPYPFSFRATLYRGATNVSRIAYRVVMSRNQADEEYLCYEIDYAQGGFVEDQPSYTIFNEKLFKGPGDNLLFDRSDPDQFPLSQGLELEVDRSLFSALRIRHLSATTTNEDPLLAYCAQQISKFNKFRLDPNVLAQPSRLPDIPDDPSTALPPRIGYHGEDLAATLYYMSQTRASELDFIKTKLKDVDSEFQDFEFNVVGTDRIAFAAVYADRRQTVPSVRLSAGILIYLGLIVLVSAPNRPPVLMIEEPENGLTPQALKAFYKSVRALAVGERAGQQSQVLLSSHSPFVICEAWNGDDLDFIHQVKISGGKAVVRRFSQVVEEQQIQLAKDSSGARTHLSLSNAEEIMSGYLS